MTKPKCVIFHSSFNIRSSHICFFATLLFHVDVVQNNQHYQDLVEKNPHRQTNQKNNFSFNGDEDGDDNDDDDDDGAH